LIFLSQAVPTTIFGLTVGFFPFFGLPIFSLSLAMIFSSAKQLTLVGTVGLAPKATPANTKRQIAPSTSQLKQ
jgi:hypothetical protein